jgi:hypothetical protein
MKNRTLMLEQLEDRCLSTVVAGVSVVDTLLANGVHRLTIAPLHGEDRVFFYSNRRIDVFYGSFGAYNIVQTKITSMHGQLSWNVTLSDNDVKAVAFNVPWQLPPLLRGRRYFN